MDLCVCHKALVTSHKSSMYITGLRPAADALADALPQRFCNMISVSKSLGRDLAPTIKNTKIQFHINSHFCIKQSNN